jgi:hypothetical protein
MKKEDKKTDESVRAGLQIQGDTKPEETASEDGLTEKDVDEEVHEAKNEVPDVSEESDLDEVVHEQTGGITTSADIIEKDIDDAMHQK